jgi:hypothetical protein
MKKNPDWKLTSNENRISARNGTRSGMSGSFTGGLCKEQGTTPDTGHPGSLDAGETQMFPTADKFQCSRLGQTATARSSVLWAVVGVGGNWDGPMGERKRRPP